MSMAISFNVKKKEQILVRKPKCGNADGFIELDDKAGQHQDEDSTHFISCLDAAADKARTEKDNEEKEPVIPLIRMNRWRNAMKPGQLEDDEDPDTGVGSSMSDLQKKLDKLKAMPETPETVASREILEESLLYQIHAKDSSQPVVPLLVQNKIPEGFETDERLNTELRPDEPLASDYEKIAIEKFGKAMLRGMGFREDVGIGKTARKVKMLEASARPKGLGLGAVREDSKLKNSGTESEEKELKMAKGAFCLIESGKHEGSYGMIEAVDGDTSRAIVKLSIVKASITIHQLSLKIVTRKEFEKNSKYLNKRKADEIAEKEQKKLARKEEQDQREEDNAAERLRLSRKPKKESRNDGKDIEMLARQEPKKRRRHKNLWLRPQLRVRIIDSRYKKGRYFKAKVVIEDVVSKDHCVCRDEDGRLLDGISQSMLETVIPKAESCHVYVTSGRWQGQIGKLISRSRSHQTASVQLLQDRSAIADIHFDNICEFSGSIEEEFDY